MSVAWNENTAAELTRLAAEGAVVLLPVASTEQHGPHLATGVDDVLCGTICRRAAEMAGEQGRAVVVAPTLPFGLAEHHVAFGGSFTLGLSTYHVLLRDLCRSILRAGFSRILIVNGHGGNASALNALTVDLTRELDAPIATTTYFHLAQAEIAAELEDQKSVLHACEAETSMMMAVAPSSVRSDALPDAFGPTFDSAGSALHQPIHLWKSFKDLSPSGVLGDARRASRQKGERLVEACARALADRLVRGEPWG